MLTTLQNTPVTLDLASQARSTGWTIENGYAVHESCNSGFISVVNALVPIIAGQSYEVSYQLAERTNGGLQMRIGDTVGINRTINGNYSETLVASGISPLLRFYSNGDMKLKLLDVKPLTTSTVTRQTNSVTFSEGNNKYTSFLPYTSDYGFSIFKDLLTFKGGRLYKHDPEIIPRNNVYGVQYDTTIKIPFNLNPGQPKTFESISYEGNVLMITTVDGITTTLGQISELIADDFLKDVMIDGATQVNIYDVEGVKSASFMRDKNIDIINGDELKGTGIVIELITVGVGILKLKNVVVNSVPSKIGSR